MQKFTAVFITLLTGFSAGYGYRAFTSSTPPAVEVKRVTGIGGIFFKSKNPAELRSWYAKHLGLETNTYGSVFEWYQGADSTKKGFTQWSPFKETTRYFAPSTNEFMINDRVADLQALLVQLKNEGVTITDTMETYDYGKFVHIMDPEGNKIELWEPNDVVYESLGIKMGTRTTK